MRRPPALALVAALLSACVADPAPERCESGRDCPADAPWCVAGACATRSAADAGPGCDPSARCADDCDWLLGCAARICPGVLDGNPALADELFESCLGQCLVDDAISEALCGLADDGACRAAVDETERVLGVALCP